MKKMVSAFAVGVSVSLFAGLAAAQDDLAEPPAGDTEAAVVEDKAETDISTGDIATDDGKVKLGLRLGYGIPMGDAADGAELGDFVSGMIPIWVDAGYMVTPNIMVGAYFQYGIASIADDFCGEADCSGSDVRFGVQGQYHFSPGQKIQPWAGIGVGYEIANINAEIAGVEASFSTKGFEFLNLQGGADFEIANAFVLGPFASFSLGQYSSSSSGGESEDIEDKAIHQWLTIGAKGTFSL
jgi:opacity protein-like surface antigen